MAGKSQSKASDRTEKNTTRPRQLRWARIAFGIFALLLILSMVLSLVAKN